MNEMVLKGIFLKELYKGNIIKICLFYNEQAGMLTVGVNNDEVIDYKKECSIKVAIVGRVKQTQKENFRYNNQLYLREYEYSNGVEK